MSATFTRLILVRHGETAANREFRYIGTRDDALTEQGQSQAAAVAEALRQLPITAIYSSPRQRTQATAAPIAAALGLPVTITEALVEGSFGRWEGLSRAEVLALSSAEAALLHAWEADATVAPPGGEALSSVQRRVAALADALAQEQPGATCVLVSHVGPIKGLVAAALGADPAVARALFLDPATISVVDWGPRRLLRLFNSHAHLGWLAARWLDGPR